MSVPFPGKRRPNVNADFEPQAALPLRILLADDHALLRQRRQNSDRRYGLTVVAEAGDGREAVRLAEATPPDVAMLDVMMPLLNGTDVVREIRRVSPRTKSLLLTMHTDDAFAFEALRAGVKGYVLKTQPVAEVVDAIHHVANGSFYLSPGISQTVLHAY